MADHYNRVADAYAAKNSEDNIPSVLRDLRDAFLAEVDGDRILDAGCGHGRDTAYFAKEGYDAVGVDAALNMLAQDPQEGAYVAGDMRVLPFQDESFDAVWACTSIFLLEHGDQGPAAQEMARVLNDGGVAYIGFKTADADDAPDTHTKEEFGSTVTQYFPSTATAQEMVEQATFEEVQVHSESKNADGYDILNLFAFK